MSDQNVVRSGGVGFGGLLAILFIGLKLGGIINWSWWWVLSPLWIPAGLLLGLALLIAAGACLIGIIAGAVNYVANKRR